MKTFPLLTFTLLATLLATVLAGCASHTGRPASASTPEPIEVEFTRLDNQVYTPADWPEPLAADVYLPDTPGLRPAILVVHGGGWTRRSPDDMTAISESLARHGFVVVNIAYRFAPAYRFPAQLHDLQQAMHWIHANATRFDIDPRRIGGFGYSAGAHLVALLALTSNGDTLDAPYGGPETRLSAAAVGGTPADLNQWPDSPLVNDLIGASRSTAPETWAAASPLTHVSPDDPPFFIYHGGMDRLVEPEQADALKAALDKASVHAELYRAPLHGHVSMFVFGGGAVDAGTAFLARELSP